MYAEESGQHPVDPSGRLSDGIDGDTVYLVAARGETRIGFVGLTPPWVDHYSLDKYLTREEPPVLTEEEPFEIRILTVEERWRSTAAAPLLMYAAPRWAAARGGHRVVAMGRTELLAMYLAAGLRPVGRTVRSDAVSFEVLSGSVRCVPRRSIDARGLPSYVLVRTHDHRSIFRTLRTRGIRVSHAERTTRTARFTVDPDFTVGPVDPRLFGSFVEHLGRCVYTGIHEPGHPTADEDGLRTDVLELVRELGVTAIRYPGGNFVSGYRWEDGVGPVGERPRRLDVAWRSTESNRFGLSEFMTFLRKAGPEAEPMMALNLGTRGITEAMDLVEYANHPGGTELSDRRVAHGDKDPFGIRLWCLGNEMDGTWQTGQKTAEEYGRLAAQTARALRSIDPDLELVACGSSARGLPTFAAWEAIVLAETYEVVDHVSLHAYYEETDGDRDSFLASAVEMEAFIEEVVATCDHVGARLKSSKKLTLSFDEWNVWYQRRPNPHPVEDWQEAPRLLEDVYTVTDAVVFGTLVITLLRHADRVAVACLAQLVNVIAPIMTEPGGPAWRQTTFFPFAQASRYGRGTVLDVRVDAPTYPTDRYGDVPLLHATAVRGEDGGVTVFAVNRGRNEPLTLEVALRGLDLSRVVEHSALADADPEARNTPDAPERVVPHAVEGATLVDGTLRAVLEPMSWNVLRLR